ncbi:hypothetical protein [Nocardioides sp. B-3]|uniref:hypothetical protein n=1 Tax=Nocardioides sp. B-3 TaxID=2895565 RepID=UPI0021538A53|nr:hypothetical protein [Nocardioides sp. B-3]UUZ58133.1 hypothetical protein LP418_17895 [Nocardioides sp. B-3]
MATEADNDRATDPSSETTSETPSESPSEATTEAGALPECADVWVDGQVLPADYTACTTDGETIKPAKKKCGYGATFIEQDGRFFAMKGNEITDAGDLETNADYQQLLATCQSLNNWLAGTTNGAAAPSQHYQHYLHARSFAH